MGSTLHQPPAVYFMGKDLFYIQEMVVVKTEQHGFSSLFIFFLFNKKIEKKLNMKSFILMKFMRYTLSGLNISSKFILIW